MGVLGRDYCDDSELTEEELAYYRPLLKQSLYDDHLKYMGLLSRAELFDKTEAGIAELMDVSWSATITNNALCKEISAISAQRRLKREEAEAARRGVMAALPAAAVLQGVPGAPAQTLPASKAAGEQAHDGQDASAAFGPAPFDRSTLLH